MSSIYVTEPPTKGKVLIVTNRGEIEIELWSKEAPKAVRNFVQLCLEGYYIDTIFHRIVPDFVIQGGDPTATGTGGQSIYDEPFQDEFHSRLKYNRRGLLGMANNGKHDNGSQFFITLDATPELQGKNTLFGRVMGDTIYNVTKMGQSEMETGTDRPRYPPKITKTEVLVNPFDDIEPRTTRQELEQRREAQRRTARPIAKSAKKNPKLLSFAHAEEAGDDGLVSFKPRAKGKSTHDLLSETPSETSIRRTTNSRKRKMTPPSEDEPETLKTAELDEIPDPEAARPNSPSPVQRSAQEDSIAAQIAALKSTLKRKKQDREDALPPQPLSKVAQQRLMYAKKAVIGGRKARKGDEEDVMAALASFQSKISAPTQPLSKSVKKVGKVCALHSVPNCQSCAQNDPGAGEDDDDEGWYMNTLVFEDDKLGKDARFKERAEQELEMIDPREKAGQLALAARSERRRADEKFGRNEYLRRR